jgi:hypothetical protein
MCFISYRCFRTLNYVVKNYVSFTTNTNLYLFLIYVMLAICFIHLIIVGLIILIIIGVEIVKHVVIL